MIEIHRLGARIGAEIRGVDVKALDDAGFAAIYRAWLDCNVVVVPGQDLQIEDSLRYSRRFGVVHPHPSKMTRHPDHPEITLLGVDKFRPDGALDMAVYRRGAEGWHTDGAYDQEPFKATQLYALAVPSTGGDTLFASMYAAYERCHRGSRSTWTAGPAPSPTAAGERRRHCSMPRIETGHRSSIRSSARIPRPGGRRSTSIPERSCASRGSTRARATR